MHVKAEFTTEPFVGEGQTPEHVLAALQVTQRHGLAADFGPFGTAVVGEEWAVLSALLDVMTEALAHGATRITVQVERTGAPSVVTQAGGGRA